MTGALYGLEDFARGDAVAPECVLPGCRESVGEVGQVCPGCIDAFGSYLATVDRAPITAADIEQRDIGTRAAYAKMNATAQTPTERKPNQMCWLCEQRRACTLVDGRWECAACAPENGDPR